MNNKKLSLGGLLGVLVSIVCLIVSNVSLASNVCLASNMNLASNVKLASNVSTASNDSVIHQLSEKENRAESTIKPRIIALSPHLVEMLYAIGAGEQIIGTVEWANFPSQAQKIERVGNFAGLRIERIVELKPDYILAWRSGNRAIDLDKLESLGFNLVYSKPETIQDVIDDIVKLGELTQQTAKSKALATKIAADYRNVLQQYKYKTPISVFYQMWHDPLRTVGDNNWVDHLISDCGGQNVFSSVTTDYPIVSLESVLSKNPQVILVPSHPGVFNERKSIWQSWKSIDAVKNKHMYPIDGDVVHRFGPRAVEGLLELCEKIDRARVSR